MSVPLITGATDRGPRAPDAGGVSLVKALPWLAFVTYTLVVGLTLRRHELTSDEVHSWNIVKASANLADVLHNSRYEGHPPAWYVLLWPLSRFTHDPVAMQVLHGAVACCVALLILVRSPLPLAARLLAPFGYFLLFEYAVISRNYSIGVLIGLWICLHLWKKRGEGTFFYYLLLALLSMTHLLAAVLAGSLHLGVLARISRKGDPARAIVRHAIVGLVVLLPSAWFVFPPSDSALNAASWAEKWSAQQVRALAQAPLRAFLPVPAWWNPNFWNTQALLEARIDNAFLRFTNPLVAALVLASAFYVLRTRAGKILFLSNLALTFLIAATALPLTTARHSGFLFIGFVLALCLDRMEAPCATRRRDFVTHALFALQIVGGLFATWKDVRLPFTHLPRIAALAQEVPPGSKLVTDYWTMNAYSAFVDEPIYCVDMRRDLSFVLFDRRLAEALKNPARYSDGFREIFRARGERAAYMVSLSPREKLEQTDRSLAEAFRVVTVDQRDGAIDRNGNLYLYRVTPR